MLIGIENTPRDYAWGSATAIAELLGRAPSGGPEAELWLGAHPGSPARIVDEDAGATGATGADDAPAPRTLLDAVEGRLPFLLKVLAAASPLSLQAHPTPAQAEAGFAAEEAAGIPIDAPERNYKDAFHKPELIYALSDPFRALCGFREVELTRAVLAPVAEDPRIRPLLDRLVDDAALEDVFTWLITRGDGVDGLLKALVEVAGEAALHDIPSWRTVRQLAEAYPGDPGIAISLLIHTVELAPGEVLYLPAGNIHAYLGGLGIELMAASDNVLRGGLTPKHVDVPELRRVLDFRPLPVPYLPAEHPAPGVSVFRPDVPDFVLTVVDDAGLAAGATLPLDGPAIVLCLEGGAALSAGGGEGRAETAAVERGDAVYLDGHPELVVFGSGKLVVASGSLAVRSAS